MAHWNWSDRDLKNYGLCQMIKLRHSICGQETFWVDYLVRECGKFSMLAFLCSTVIVCSPSVAPAVLTAMLPARR